MEQIFKDKDKEERVSITVTKGEYLRGSRFYKTSGTIERGIAKLRS